MSDLPQGTYNIDPVHSSVSFKVQRGLGTFRAGFHGPTGSYTDGALSGEVAVDNIVLPAPDAFKAHLTSDEWFDAAGHPSISWTSTSVTADGDKLTFVGNLTIKGTTKEITGTGTINGPAEIPTPNGPAEMMGIDIVSVINASEFGIGGGFLGDPTTIEIALTLAP